MDTDLRSFCKKLLAATKPEDIFGTLPGPDQLSAMKRTFRHMIILVHPDRHADVHDHAEIEAAFNALVKMRDEAELLIAAGTFGKDRNPRVTASVVSKLGTYKLREQYRTGDVADLFLGDLDGKQRLLKITRKMADNDLLDNENRVLTELHKQTGDKAKVFQKYFPKVLDSFATAVDGKHRRTNVLDLAEGYVSFAEIRAAYPDGIDPRDAAWMVRRAFEGMGWVHSLGYVHGALVPEHILIHPLEHGARIVGWSYAVRKGQKITAISGPRKDFYPPAVFQKKPTTTALDVQMIAASAQFLLSDVSSKLRRDIPDDMARFFGRCKSGDVQDGWTAYREYDVVLNKVYGKRAYRAFSIPK